MRVPATRLDSVHLHLDTGAPPGVASLGLVAGACIRSPRSIEGRFNAAGQTGLATPAAGYRCKSGRNKSALHSTAAADHDPHCRLARSPQTFIAAVQTHVVPAWTHRHLQLSALRRPSETAGAGTGEKRGLVCLISIDLDHFEQLNDAHGHAMGNAVLKRTVMSCQEQLRPANLFGRLGGGEFGVLLRDCPRAKAMQLPIACWWPSARYRSKRTAPCSRCLPVSAWPSPKIVAMTCGAYAKRRTMRFTASRVADVAGSSRTPKTQTGYRPEKSAHRPFPQPTRPAMLGRRITLLYHRFLETHP